MLASLSAAHSTRVSPGQARLNGLLGPLTLRILPALAGLQVWPTGCLVKADQGPYAVARTLSPRPPQVSFARHQVLIIGQVAVSLLVAPEQGLPADQLAIQRHREGGEDEEREEEERERWGATWGLHAGGPCSSLVCNDFAKSAFVHIY